MTSSGLWRIKRWLFLWPLTLVQPLILWIMISWSQYSEKGLVSLTLHYPGLSHTSAHGIVRWCWHNLLWEQRIGMLHATRFLCQSNLVHGICINHGITDLRLGYLTVKKETYTRWIQSTPKIKQWWWHFMHLLMITPWKTHSQPNWDMLREIVFPLWKLKQLMSKYGWTRTIWKWITVRLNS